MKKDRLNITKFKLIAFSKLKGTLRGGFVSLDIVSEAELRSAVAQTRDRLNQDLKAVREVMRSAQQAVVDALTSLKGVPKVDEASSTTSTSATLAPESGTLGN